MKKKNSFGICSSSKEEHISLLRYSKSACGVDFLLNTAESYERESWFNLYSNYKTDFFEFFFFRKANGYVIVNGGKHRLEDNSLLIISPYQRQEWHVDIAGLDYTFLIFQEEFIYNFISDKQFMYRLLYCYQNKYPTYFRMPEQDIRNFTDTLGKIKQELLNPIAEGYNIFADNDMFRRDFGSFQRRFGIRSVLDGCFFAYPSEHDREEFLRQLVKKWVMEYTPSEVMLNLKGIVGDKDYFIVTTNADTHLEKSGFSPDKVFELEGTFVQLQQHGKISDKSGALNDFIAAYAGRKLLVLELGVGSRNRMIKEPLMQLVAQNPSMSYITLNMPHEIYISPKIADRSVALAGDISDTLKQLRQC